MRIAELGSGMSMLATLGALLSPAGAAGAAQMVVSCENCLMPRQPFMPVTGRFPSQAPAQSFHNRDDAFHVGGADDPFHVSGAVIRGQTDHVSRRIFGSAQRGLTIEAARRIAKRAYSLDRTGSSREKLSLAAASIRYDSGSMAGGMLSFGLNGSFEKRRFALDLADGHMARSQSAGVEAAWSNASGWRLASGYRADIGNAASSFLVRGIQLAEGARRTQRGPWIGITYRPPGSSEERGVSVGIRMQAMNLAQRDRVALGAPGAQDDRIALTTMLRFR